MANSSIAKHLPFAGLSDYQVMWECSSAKNRIFQRYDESNLVKVLKNNVPDHALGELEIDSKYYEDEQFNNKFGMQPTCLSVFHVNIRKLGKHRSQLVAYLSCLKHQFDVIILTEIGIDAFHYMSQTFENCMQFFQLPKLNEYGGVGIFVRDSHYEVVEREDLCVEKTCTCKECNFENVWVEITDQDQKYIIGGIYRHPNGKISHFNNDLENSLNKMNKQDV